MTRILVGLPRGRLISNLYQYIRENNPDVLIELKEYGGITKFFSDKVTLLILV